jgi:hypothetical protein
MPKHSKEKVEKTFREKNPSAPAFLLDHWSGVTSEAADKIKEATRGYVKIRPIDPKKILSKGQQEAGWTVEPVSGKDQVENAKLILTKMVKDSGEQGILAELAEQTFEQLQQTLLGDGRTPALDTWDKFRQYLAYGPDMDITDFDNPDVKKNLVLSN